MKSLLFTASIVAVGAGIQALANGPDLPPWGQRLGWTLVHSTWQLALIALVASLLDALFRRQSPRVRYACGVLCLFAMPVISAATWATIQVPNAPPPRASASSPDATTSPDASFVPLPGGTEVSSAPAVRIPQELVTDPNQYEPPQSPAPSVSLPMASEPPRVAASWSMPWQQAIDAWLRPILFAWLAGVAICALRPIVGLWTQRRLQRQGLSPVAADITRLMADLSRRMNVSPLVRIAESALVSTPMVVGYLRPVILLPASVLTGLAPAELQSLLAHELAHVRRHDWIVNSLQVMLETVLFYHPAAWWLSHRVRCERELCCDDLALAVTGDGAAYGRMLLSLEQLRCHATPALAATGGDLVYRVRRLLPAHVRPATGGLGWSIGSLLSGLSAVVLLALLTAISTEAQQSKPNEPKPPIPLVVTPGPVDATSIATPNEQNSILRGRVVMEDGKGIPADLKVQSRVTGSNFAENPRDVAVDKQGSFQIPIRSDAEFVRIYATSTAAAPASSPRIDVRNGLPADPVTITMPRGRTVRLLLAGEQGLTPESGTARVRIRNVFEPDLGTFPVRPGGILDIPHCPDDPVQIDLLMPGFEEQRIHRRLLGDQPIGIDIRSTPAVRLRLVNSQKQPIAGASVRLYSRVRAGSFLRPRMQWGDGPIWATSDAQGQVALTTLCLMDPVPTNIPGPADYAFRIDVAGMAPYFIGDVRAGSDLGTIELSEALTVQGEIVPTPNQPERVSVQWRQATIAQGATTGKGDWQLARLEDIGGRQVLKLGGLRSGPLDLFVTFSDPSVPESQPIGTRRQLQFHGQLTGSSTGLKITGESILPGDSNLTAVRGSLFPIDDESRANLPPRAIHQLVEAPLSKGPPQPAALQMMIYWSHTAPIKHSMGFGDWRLFVLQNGVVFVPGHFNDEAGAIHKLTEAELSELLAQFDKHAERWKTRPPVKVPEQGGWRHGQDVVSYTRDGKTSTLETWDGTGQDDDADVIEIRRVMEQVITEAKFGGRQKIDEYRALANLALKSSFGDAAPLVEGDWCNATIRTDGTREMTFGRTSDRTRVSMVHPVGGPPYVEYVEVAETRRVVQLPDVPKTPVAAKLKRQWSVFGRVVDDKGEPVRGAHVWASTGIGSLRVTGQAETDAEGRYEFDFGPGVFLSKGPQLQAATIMARKPDHFEKNLSRQGDLLMAVTLPEKLSWGKHTNDDVILPDAPRRVDFVLVPAARLAGTLVDDNGRPLVGYSIALTGEDLPPSSSVMGSCTTDDKGRFELREIPTGYKFQILVEPKKREPPWNAWASQPFDFRISPGDEFFVREADREVAANRFELQVKGSGVNWKQALKTAAASQTLEPTGDYLTSPSRLHAATLRLTLSPREETDTPNLKKP
jgi:beta-lactamase regulating signal transducer with metallopeptidase domain